jgi:hypothetical protein
MSEPPAGGLQRGSAGTHYERYGSVPDEPRDRSSGEIVHQTHISFLLPERGHFATDRHCDLFLCGTSAPTAIACILFPDLPLSARQRLPLGMPAHSERRDGLLLLFEKHVPEHGVGVIRQPSRHRLQAAPRISQSQPGLRQLEVRLDIVRMNALRLQMTLMSVSRPLERGEAIAQPIPQPGTVPGIQLQLFARQFQPCFMVL